jgi:hypothetical protein
MDRMTSCEAVVFDLCVYFSICRIGIGNGVAVSEGQENGAPLSDDSESDDTYNDQDYNVVAKLKKPVNHGRWTKEEVVTHFFRGLLIKLTFILLSYHTIIIISVFENSHVP